MNYSAKVTELIPAYNAKLKEDEVRYVAGTKDMQVITKMGDEYEGAYEVTPTQETQVLQTENLAMTRNVVINPIPSNYGLITWNGSVLTVS